MAEIEVLLDFGTPYVRLDDYNAMKERYWKQVALTQDADDEAAKWKEHARAALARAEAAEALAYERLENMLFAEQRANDAANDAADAELHLRRAEQAAEQLAAENRRLTARVAELEAALKTAGEWRPVTESEPAEEQDVELIAIGYRGYDGKWYYRGDSPLRGWRPLPPPDAPQEPTP